MPRPRLVPTPFTFAAPTATTTTESVRPGSGRLKVATVGTGAASDGPVRAIMRVGRFGRNIPIAEGWIRGGSRESLRLGSLKWDGDIPLDDDVEIEVTVRNDTGAAVAINLVYLVE